MYFIYHFLKKHLIKRSDDEFISLLKIFKNSFQVLQLQEEIRFSIHFLSFFRMLLSKKLSLSFAFHRAVGRTGGAITYRRGIIATGNKDEKVSLHYDSLFYFPLTDDKSNSQESKFCPICMTLRVVMGFFGVFVVAIIWKATDTPTSPPQPVRAPNSGDSS